MIIFRNGEPTRHELPGLESSAGLIRLEVQRTFFCKLTQFSPEGGLQMTILNTESGPHLGQPVYSPIQPIRLLTR